MFCIKKIPIFPIIISRIVAYLKIGIGNIGTGSRGILFITVISFFTAIYTACAQNLVPNPGFEEDSTGDFSGLEGGWQKCVDKDSPDYFSFADSSTVHMFSKYFGGIKPHSGKAYCGIFCYRRTTNYKFREIREFIEVPLLHPLVEGQRYYIKFYVALDAESTACIDNFGMYFSDTLIQHVKTRNMYKLIPQVENPFYKFLRNKEDWMMIEGDYQAMGNEAYIIIGNFHPDEDTHTRRILRFPDTELPKKEKWRKQQGEEIAYYYIDDVLVGKWSDYAPPKKPVKKPERKTDTIVEPKQDFTLLKQGETLSLDRVMFDFGEIKWLPSSEDELENLYKFLKENPDTKIEIIGYTDNVGTEKYNVELSLARAKAIANYLIQRGIAEDRLKYIGKGSANPVSDNNTEEGREKNRRVEIKIADDR